jgi:hypothetical protein
MTATPGGMREIRAGWVKLDDNHGKPVAHVSWPSPQDYNEAVQNPSSCFTDSQLASSQAETDSFGLPRPNTGMFASVYKMCCEREVWALRCFLRFVPDQGERYAEIGRVLNRQQFSCMLHFDWQERGILVHGRWFPVLKMQWCDGENLDFWLAGRLHDRPCLSRFLVEWKNVLRSLEGAGIAHGDLQHGNVLVSNGRVQLVDYDAMYVPALQGRLSSELGHRDYQHPGRTWKHFGPGLDNFSAWVIYLSVQILSIDPQIWDQLGGGDDCLIFRQRDFAEPLRSPAFHLLEAHRDPEIRLAARTLRYLLSLACDEIPPLSEDPPAADHLPELLAAHAFPGNSCRDEDLACSSQPGGSPGQDFEEMSEAPVYYGKKRVRSRLKGGSTAWRPPAHSPPPAPPPPPVLSPLALLARKVRGVPLSPAQAESARQFDSSTTAALSPSEAADAGQMDPADCCQASELASRFSEAARKILWCLLLFVALASLLGLLALLSALFNH